jgi:uncharacterized RDD family membrane protein YckC
VSSTEKFIPLPADYLRALPAPTLGRRIALNLYELLVLMGVAALTFLVPHLLIGVFFQITLPAGFLLAHLYLVFAFYFVWYWTKTGQTLAMQTWKIQLVSIDGYLLSKPQALIRYAYSSLWLIVASIVMFILLQLGDKKEIGTYLSLIFFSMTLFFWPLTVLLDPKKQQTLPDRWAKTRLVQLPRVIPHPISSREK